MLKREITYKDFDGNECTDIFYFNISEPELVDLEVKYPRGLLYHLENIINAKDNKTIVDTFKELVLLAYGIRSDDGKHFIKSDEIRTMFSHHAAYAKLYMELAFDDGAAAAWVKGVLPADLAEKAEKAGLQDKMAEALGTDGAPSSSTT